MKSEHRHELQTNSLASELGSLPETLRKHSSKILTVLALILLVIAGIRYKRSQDAVQQETSRMALASAWNSLAGLAMVDPLSPSSQRQQQLDEVERDVKTAVQQVIDQADASSDKAMLAGAYWASGELYWGLANNSPLATTQPATQPTTRPTNYLEMAKSAYQKIVTDYADQNQPVIAARFALAAIAENRHDWGAAREQYKILVNPDTFTPSVTAMAQARLDLLERFEKPMLHLPASQPVADAHQDNLVPDAPGLTFGPATAGPATAPTTPAPAIPAPTTPAPAATGPALPAATPTATPAAIPTTVPSTQP